MDCDTIRTPEFFLWLSVVVNAAMRLNNGWSDADEARAFLLDPSNPFFEYVCCQIGIDPDKARQRLLEMAENQPGAIKRLAQACNV